MKISCSACSKKYDALKTEGICPYCGMHATDQQISLSRENDRVQGGSVTEVLRSYLNERLRKQQKLSVLRQKKVQIPLCIAMVLMLLGLGLWGNHRYQERFDYYTSRRRITDARTETLLLGESADIGTVRIQFTDSRIRDDLQSKVGGDFTILEVTYHDSGSTSHTRLSDAFVLTDDGCNAKSLNDFDMRELLELDEAEFRNTEYESGVYTSAVRSGDEHKLLFAVPKKDTRYTVVFFGMSDIYARDNKIDTRYELKLGEGAEVW